MDLIHLVYRPPPGVLIKPLPLRYAGLANEIWPHKCYGSSKVISNVIELNLSKAVFSESDELLGFILRSAKFIELTYALRILSGYILF